MSRCPVAFLSSPSSPHAVVVATAASAVTGAVATVRRHVACAAAAVLLLLLRSDAAEKYNAVVDICFDAALKRAAAVDASLARGDDVAGGLLGVPISIKESIEQAGHDCTHGAASKCFNVSAADGLTVQLLQDAGAIVVARSNVPQLLMLPETDNHVYGRTDNPFDALRTPGGSSGGVCACVCVRARCCVSSVFSCAFG